MISAIVALLIGLLLAVAAIQKLSIAPQFKAAVATWGIVPIRWRAVASRSIPAVEFAVAMFAITSALLYPHLRLAALSTSAGLFLGFAGVQIAIRSRKPDADCGCFSNARLGAASISRAGALGVVCVVAALV